MCVQNLKFVALPVLEIIGGRYQNPKIGQSLDIMLSFLQSFNGLLFEWTAVIVVAKVEVHSFTHANLTDELN